MSDKEKLEILLKIILKDIEEIGNPTGHGEEIKLHTIFYACEVCKPDEYNLLKQLLKERENAKYGRIKKPRETNRISKN